MAKTAPKFAVICYDGGDPKNFIAKGHVDIKEFNRRLKAKVGTDPLTEKEITYIYGEWKFSKKWPDGYFHVRKPSDKNAKPYTATENL